MDTYFSADDHFGHFQIIKYCNRPFKSVKEMDDTLIKNWNERVKKDDFVINVGDFNFRNSKGGKQGTPKKSYDYIKKLNGIKTFVSGNHCCVSMDTRILTKDGWKFYNEIEDGDLIPNINLKSKKLEFKPIKKIIITNVDKVYKFKHRNAIFKFSENHRHIFSFGTNNCNSIRIKTSKELFEYDSPVKLIGAFQSGNKEYNISDEWIKLLAWILTDGGIHKKYKHVSLYQSKPKYIKEIQDLLKKLKFDYRFYKRQRNITHICGKKLKKDSLPAVGFHFRSENSKIILKKLQLEDKEKFPEWLYFLSDRQYNIFIQEACKANGGKGSSNTISLWGKSKVLEQFLALNITHNIKSNLITDCRGDNHLTICKRKQSKEDFLQYKQFANDNRTIEVKAEKMWCIEIENENFFMERNGQTLLTGNSRNGMKTKIQNLVVRYSGKRYYVVHSPSHANEFYEINLVGHIHDAWKIKRLSDKSIMYNVGVDVNDFRPVNFQEIISNIAKWIKNGEKCEYAEKFKKKIKQKKKLERLERKK